MRMHTDRDAASIIHDGDRVIYMDGDLDFRTVPGQRLINGVVYNFIDQMMQSGNIHISNIHGRS